MTSWNGIPLEKAIIVRHEKGGAESAKGGNAGRAVDYIARGDDHAGRGGVDREPTRRDMELAREREMEIAREALDYIAREREFSQKGAERQIDATLWGERGPMTREEALGKMAGAGCFISSIVTVDRRYAGELGLDSKQAFQELMRSTWRENAERWGVFRDPGSIDWVAAYHTDAERSLHVHVYTWGGQGDLKPGQTVSREGTRAGKEAIYSRGYATIREQRDERRTFLRDLSRQNIARQLGGAVDEGRVGKLHGLAQRRGWGERVPPRPDWDRGRSPDVVRLAGRLADELEGGRGRLGKNYAAGAVARDLVRALEKASPATRAIKDGMAHCEAVSADLKGYTSDAYKGREDILRRGREDYLSRLVPTVERACAGPERERGRERGPEREERPRERERAQSPSKEPGSRARAASEGRGGWGRSALASIAAAALAGTRAGSGKLPGPRRARRRGYDREYGQGREQG